MPIYDFRCQDCGEVSELRVPSYSASSTATCSSCGSHEVERLISAPSLLRSTANTPGTTCCGREERCDAAPCASGDTCRRQQGG